MCSAVTIDSVTVFIGKIKKLPCSIGCFSFGVAIARLQMTASALKESGILPESDGAEIEVLEKIGK